MSKYIDKNKTTILFLILFLFSFFLTSCTIVAPCDQQVISTDYSASETFDLQYSPQNISSIRVSNLNGSVLVIGRSSIPTISVAGEREVRSESEQDAEEHLQYLKVIVDESGGELLIRTEQPDNSYGREYRVDYQIEIPQYLDVIINQENGEIHIDTLHGDVSIESGNGNIYLDSLSGNISTNLANGNTFGIIQLPLNGSCQMTTANGLIILSIPVNTSALFYASVVNGQIGLSNLQLANIQGSSKSVSGILGNGEGTIDLKVSNGTISVSGY